jgi:hypothetical protein
MRLPAHETGPYYVRVARRADPVCAFLSRVRRAVAQNRLELTNYARDGIREMGWEIEDVQLQLVELAPGDFLRIETSVAVPTDVVWVFAPEHWDGGSVWIRLVERSGILVVSLHRG